MTGVTERKSVEEIIESSEVKFRGLFESSRDGIVFCDMEGVILNANGSFLNMLGFEKDEIVGRKLVDITPQKWHRMEDEMSFQKLAIEGDTGQYDKEYIKKDGTAIPISARSWLMRDERGETKGIWSMARDVSEELRSKEEIKRRMIEIEKLNKFMIGREMRIIEMKREVNDLLRKSDQTPRYKV